MQELPSSGAVGAVAARELLAESAGLRRLPGRPPGLWPPLVAFGIVAVAGAPVGALSSLAAGIWWACTAPVAFAVVGACSSRLARRRGAEPRSLRLPALGVASFAAGWLACVGLAVALHLPGGLTWTIAVAVGYLAWSRLARSLAGAAVAVAIGGTGTALALSPAPGWTVEFGVGTVMIIGGLVLRSGPEAA